MRWLLLVALGACGTPGQGPDAGCEGPWSRACATEADCALLHDQVDCCGTEVVRGIAAAGLSAAQQRELACVATGPVCRCAARPTVAEDGKTFPEAAALKLRCSAGRCESFVN